MKRPVNLLYGLNDKPPLLVTVLSGLQHGAILVFTMLTALVICREADAAPEVIVNVLSVGLLMAGLGTILQSRRAGPIGSGYLVPNGSQSAYLGPSIVAAHLGGLPLVFGMTIFAGFVEGIISRFWYRLRAFLPPELSGLVVLLIGIQIASVGLRNLLEPVAGKGPTHLDFAVAALTLASMVILNVWTRGTVRLFCVLIGVAVGYAAGYGLNLVTPDSLSVVSSTPMVALPHFRDISLAFDLDMVLPFLVVGMATAMSTSANVTVVQKLNDANWARPDLRAISRATLTDGVVASTSGFVGACGVGTMATNVGIMVATGVTSRRIAFAFGATAAALAFLPRVSAILAGIPAPVIGGALLFACTFTMISGLQIITSRLLDARKSLVIGLSVATALAVITYPTLEELLPRPMQPLVGSALVAGTLVGLLLTALFRIGVRRRIEMTIDPAGDFADAIETFLLKNGTAWGARPEVIRRAIFSVTQLTEAVIEHCEVRGPIALTAQFDEFNLDIHVRYEGELLEFPNKRPSNQEILDSDDGGRRLAGFLLHKSADHIVSTREDGVSRVHFHFEH